MPDLKNPKLIIAKGFLFLALGILAATLILIEAPHLKLAALLALAIWSFCRFYYFAFYVIHHYVDPTFHFSGLLSAACYLLAKRPPPTSPH